MKVPQPLIVGRFIHRDGRFKAYVEVDGKIRKAHVHDPGRLKNLLVEGALTIMRLHSSKGRKTKFYITAVWSKGCWVLVDSALHVKLAEEAVRESVIEELKGYEVVKREVEYDGGRLDLLLKSPRGVNALLEVKGCTLTIDNVGLFPDAPTLRGRRHVEKLVKAVKEGYEGYILFLAIGCSVREFRPNYKVDPEFTEVLKEASRTGVKLLAYKVVFEDYEVKVKSSVPIRMELP